MIDKSKISELSLLEQHAILVKVANEYLPYALLNAAVVQSSMQTILNDLFQIFPKSLKKYLPNFDLIVHEDGVYNVLE